MPKADPITSVHDKNDSIQVMRALAALLVLVDHAGYSALGGVDHAGLLGQCLGHLGTLGVGLFFVISGYIMLETNDRRFGGLESSINFFIRRLLRICPIYYLGTFLAAMLLTFLLAKDVTFHMVALSALFIPSYGNIENVGFYPVLGVGWTLNLEMFFYLVFAIGLVLPRTYGVGLTSIVIVVLVLVGAALPTAGDDPTNPSLIRFYTMPIMALFAMGVLLRACRPLWPRFTALRVVIPNFYILMAAAMAAIACLHLVGMKSSRVGLVAEAVSFPLVAYAILFGARSSRAIDRMLVLLGDASYSIYIFHSLVLILLATALTPVRGIPVPVVFLLNIAVPLAVSIVMYRGIELKARTALELPARRWIEGRLPAKTAVVGSRVGRSSSAR